MERNRRRQRQSSKPRRRRQFKRPAENTAMVAGVGAVLAMLQIDSISPEMTAAIAGGIALLPKAVSETVSWFRSDEEETDFAEDGYEDLDHEEEVRRAAADALALHERMARVEASVEDLKERVNERFIDLRSEVRDHAGNHEPVAVGSGDKTTRRGGSSKR
jgi:hypothetical protein